MKLPAQRAGPFDRALGPEHVEGLPGNVISFYIVPLDPAYPAKGGTGHAPVKDRIGEIKGVLEMAGRKKIIKKKLKEPDEFISLTERAFLFIKQHFKKMATGGILVLVVLLSIFLYHRWEEKKEKEAYQNFSLALEIYQMLNSPSREGAPAEYKNVLEKLDEIITKFPRTSSGKFSLLYQGNIHLRLGEFDEAIKVYQTFVEKAGKEKLYRHFAMEGLGYAYEGKKDYEKARDAYQKIADMGDHFQMAGAYLSLGRCYEKLGKKKEALENYKAFLKISEKSVRVNAVLEKISNLEN